MLRFALIFTLLLSSLQLFAKEYVIGVVPQQSPFKLLKVWQPIAEHLSKETGHTIVFKTEKSIARFEEVLYAGGYDFAYMNPYHYTVANHLQDYVAELRAKKMIVGILVSTQTSIDKMLASKTTRYLFPSPNAFAATLLTKYELLKIYGVDVEKEGDYRYVNSHDSVYKGVARGIGDVGGGIERTLKTMQDSATRDKLHIVHRTAAYPSHPIAFKASMPASDREAITQAFMTLPPVQLEALKVKAFMRTSDAEYDTVRDLAQQLRIAPKE